MTTRMDCEGIILRVKLIRQRQILYGLIYMENLKKKKNSEIENRLVGARRGRIVETGDGDQEVQISS